jgi:murein L,D-transpeptidase YafK
VVIDKKMIVEKFPFARHIWYPIYLKLRGKRTINDVVALYEKSVRKRLQPYLIHAGFDLTPKQLALLAFKQEKMVEVWGKTESCWNKIKIYPFTATSGNPGPKLRQGDKQIPEGLYRITFLNPNSSYHLSLKIDYPNTFDKKMAKKEGRTNLGGDIFFHGRAATVGCIPIGDKAIEELFFLVQDVGMEHVQVIIAPVDFRNSVEKPEIPGIEWDKLLYDKIEQALEPFTEMA